MKKEDFPLRNDCNDPSASKKIKEYFLKYPNSVAKECCRVLKLNYDKYGERARKIKYDLNKWKQSIAPVTLQDGQVHKPHSSHRLEYCFKDPAPKTYVDIIEKKALPARIESRWYRSSNRNRQLEYFDEHISIRVYPKSRTCRILPRRIMTFDEIRARVEDGFARVLPARVLLGESFLHMIDGLQVAHRHRVFNVGLITPFRNRFYRDSLGLNILADRSHPGYLEIHENWPTWIPTLLESHRSQSKVIENNNKVLSEFTKQIKNHLHLIEGIGKATDRLNDTIESLNQTINFKLNLKKNDNF